MNLSFLVIPLLNSHTSGTDLVTSLKNVNVHQGFPNIKCMSSISFKAFCFKEIDIKKLNVMCAGYCLCMANIWKQTSISENTVSAETIKVSFYVNNQYAGYSSIVQGRNRRLIVLYGTFFIMHCYCKWVFEPNTTTPYTQIRNQCLFHSISQQKCVHFAAHLLFFLLVPSECCNQYYLLSDK